MINNAEPHLPLEESVRLLRVQMLASFKGVMLVVEGIVASCMNRPFDLCGP